MKNAELELRQKKQFSNGEQKSYAEKGQKFAIVRETFVAFADGNQTDQVDATESQQNTHCA